MNHLYMRQNSRLKWLMEGDYDKKNSIIVVNWRRRGNIMRGLLIDGSWVEDRCKVKGEVIFF